jgi:hypothetical protein
MFSARREAGRGGSSWKFIVSYTRPKPECLEQPDYYRYHDHNIQNSLDAGGHGNVRVDQPQHDADYDQRNNDSH